MSTRGFTNLASFINSDSKNIAVGAAEGKKKKNKGNQNKSKRNKKKK